MLEEQKQLINRIKKLCEYEQIAKREANEKFSKLKRIKENVLHLHIARLRQQQIELKTLKMV